MARELRFHLFRPNEATHAMCGKKTSNGSFDHEETSCKTCSGMYRTNWEWYSKIQNRVLEAKDKTGSGDLYTRLDLEVGLARLGWEGSAITALLDNTRIFRNVPLAGEHDDPWAGFGRSLSAVGAAVRR